MAPPRPAASFLALLLAGACGPTTATGDADAPDVGPVPDGAEECDGPDGGEAADNAGNDTREAHDAETAEAADAPEPEGILYAAPDGTGDACTRARPCDLFTAQDQVRARTPTMTEDVVVRLLGGRYELPRPLELDGLQDSGRGGHWVVWEAAPESRPVLSGGRRVEGWTILDAARNLWRAPAPPGLATRQLYVDGERAVRARGPWRPPGFVETAAGYSAPDDTLARWRHPEDLEVLSIRSGKAFRCGVASIDGTELTMDQPCWSLAQSATGLDMDRPTWFENAFELLDTPGGWYLDRTEGSLYWIPRAGEDPTTAEVIVPALEALVVGRGTPAEPLHHVRFEGIGFEHATWLGPEGPQGYPSLQAGWFLVEPIGSGLADRIPGAVRLEYAHGVVLRRNRFERLGGTGLVLARGCRRNDVVGNVFRDISGGAIQIGDIDRPDPDDLRDAVVDNLFRNNLVEQAGREYFDAAAVFVGYAAGTEIEHNEIRDVPYAGIFVGWGRSVSETVARENRVVANRVLRAMRRLEPGGLVYTLSAQPESRIRGNFLSSPIHPGAAIALDQGSAFFSVTDNVVVGAPSWVMLQSTAEPFAVNNLVQYNFTDSPSADCCSPLGCCTDPGRGNTLADNVRFAPDDWPLEARLIWETAGLDPEFADLRPAETRVEAEDYEAGGEGVAYHDLAPGNDGGAYRDDDVDVYPAWDASNEHVVGGVETGEWLRYRIEVDADGAFSFRFSVATPDDAGALQVDIDGRDAGMLALPNTGSVRTFETVELPGVALTRGSHRVTLTFVGGLRLDWFSWR